VKNKVNNQKKNGNCQSMPEETEYKLDNMNNNMKEKA